METMFEIACLGHESQASEPDDIPETKEHVWILGKLYAPIHELTRIRRDITSILWFTYRKGFVPIGDEGLTSDKGWGCMLRCGQMVLAKALVRIHMDPEWSWTPDTRDETYLKIVQRFEERRQAPYSIHQIALMGASEGKEVGQWFGPNTVAQVLKKLVVYDNWSSLNIHVALDNMVIIDEIMKLNTPDSKSDDTSTSSKEQGEWKPLLLIVPLRLGLSDINPIYTNGLKTCFKSPQSLGVIGGKPNQALFLIGYVGDEVIYLDPHTNQRSGTVENKETDDQKELDATYHCKYASRIPMLAMDPSVAVCFLCTTLSEFHELCETIRNDLMKEPQPLFELCQERLPHWMPNNYDGELGTIALNDFEEVMDRHFDDSDGEFELLG